MMGIVTKAAPGQDVDAGRTCTDTTAVVLGEDRSALRPSGATDTLATVCRRHWRVLGVVEFAATDTSSTTTSWDELCSRGTDWESG